MQFSVMQTELSDRLGAYDNSIAADLTKLKRWLNMGYQYVCGKMNWSFMVDYEIVQTVTDVTTGTVSVAAGGSTLTFSSGPASSVANRYIKFSSSDDWYKITAHTAASTSATISPTYGQDSALSSGTFVIRKLLYATTTPFARYLDMKKTVNPTILQSLNRREADFYLPLYLDTGDSYDYIMGPQDSSGNLQFSLVASPSSVFNLLVRGMKPIAELSADADIPIFPATWHDVVVDMGAHYGFIGLDDTRAKMEFERADVKISDMARVHNPDLGRHRVTRSSDDGIYNSTAYSLPSQYGPMQDL